MTNLLLIREPYRSNRYTRGEMYNSDTNEFICFTLEDRLRNRNAKKVNKKTAIPYGKFLGFLRHSPSRNRVVPQLVDVPGFSFIQIHSGNTIDDTEGCILVGYKRFRNKIWQSRKAESYLVDLIKKDDGNFKIRIA